MWSCMRSKLVFLFTPRLLQALLFTSSTPPSCTFDPERVVLAHAVAVASPDTTPHVMCLATPHLYLPLVGYSKSLPCGHLCQAPCRLPLGPLFILHRTRQTHLSLRRYKAQDALWRRRPRAPPSLGAIKRDVNLRIP